ncbi:MAG: hypothetical protein ACLPKH_06885 [Rhodomicrobium sp.]
MSRLGETPKEWEQRKKREKEEAEAARLKERQIAQSHVHDLARALKAEKDWLAQIRAEVTVGLCVNRRTTRSNEPLNEWVCAIRCAKRMSVDIVYRTDAYYRLVKKSKTDLLTEETFNKEHIFIEVTGKVSYSEAGYEYLGEDIDSAMAKIGCCILDYTPKPWPIRLKRKKGYVQRGCLRLRWKI